MTIPKASIIASVVASVFVSTAIAQGIDDDLWKTNSPWLSHDAIQFAAEAAAAQGGGSSTTGGASDSSGPTQTTTYPTLGDRKHGEHVIDDNGDEKIWPHKLPFLGQKVISLGYDLPEPYGISVVVTELEQTLQISNLRVSTGDKSGPYVQTPCVTFDQS